MFGEELSALGVADSFIKVVKTLYIIWDKDCDINVYNV